MASKAKNISVANSDQASLFEGEGFTFGERFLSDHAGQIVSDPQIAIVELVANAYDAGASTVDIQWPDKDGDYFEISDDGTGMTPDEFGKRWKQFNYSRRDEQGDDVLFPSGVKGKTPRKAFGQSGKGRHGAFCFADEYEVDTKKDGVHLKVKVKWLKLSDRPFDFESKAAEPCDKQLHGTKISGYVLRNRIGADALHDAIGSKFIVDPGFTIILNGVKLKLTDLAHRTNTTIVKTDLGDDITVHRIESPSQDRTTKLRGITWWVNNKMVGQPSWEGLDKQGAILDGRTQAAKRYSFVVVADCLNDGKHIRDDWSGFYETNKTQAVRRTVREHIIGEINTLLSEFRKDRKMLALGEQRDCLKQLPRISQQAVGQFIDEVQQKCPSLTDSELTNTVAIFTKMETARSGYELLQKLAACSSDDLDKWNNLMEEWTVDRAQIVLAELKRRLDLITELQKRVHDKNTDELHELQPLFAEGLWIFGPEYDSPDFIANRQMTTVVAKLLNIIPEMELSARRPDFVVLPDQSLSVFAADGFGPDGDVTGFRKILIIELKRGGFCLTSDEMTQGQKYAHELRKSSGVMASTDFHVFVLGGEIGEAEELIVGKHIKVQPMCFEAVLRRAQARTFNLHKKLESTKASPTADKEVDEVISEPMADLFAGAADTRNGSI